MNVVESLAGEIDMQPGSTVSKVVVKEGPLRLVLFAFDAGEELTEHTASLPVVIQVIEGSVAVEAGGDRIHLSPGGWLFLEAHEPHTVVAEEPSKMLLTMVRSA